MVSIPENAVKQIEKTIALKLEDSSNTLFFVGSKYAGKSTLLYSFLEKVDTPRESLVLEYSFGRKARQGQELDKTLCHIWEYGGKLNTLKSTMLTIPIQGKYYVCIMIDLSNLKSIWSTIETSFRTMHEIYSTENFPEVIIIGGKYDIFKNYDGEVKKFICITIRSLAIIHNAHVIFYSSKETQLLRRVKEILYNVGFGSCLVIKDKNTHFTKPLSIPKGKDSWENIGIAPSTLDKVKIRHLSRIASDSEPETNGTIDNISTPPFVHAEHGLDTLIASKYCEIRNNIETFN